MIFTPTARIAASYTLRERAGTITSSFAKPARLGMRTCRSGFPPATHAAVACDIAAAQPALTMPHSAPVSSARRLPTPSISSSSCTYCWFAALFAARTSGSSIEPPMIVNVPRQLMIGRTPID